MVVSTRSKRDRAISNKDCEVDKRKSKKRSKPTQVRGNTNEEREETKGSFATSFESSIKSSDGVLSKDNLRELIKELPATVIESLKCRGIERGQWKVYVAVSDTSPKMCVTQEDRLLANGSAKPS